ncbi:phytoene desaturase family protein [Alistipes sp.]|uniref:phytoene desaturase family protein n=1 Tax=Alistipes sp. TaxID=1872444 RepID=UPI003A8462AE
MKQRCVIIGSGLGGLSCGIILARNGYDVTILEQDARIGGCLQCFRRGDAKFETGMHFIGSCNPGEVLWQLLRYLEVLDDLRLSPLDPAGYEVIALRGECFRLAQGREAFIEELASRFPRERDRLCRYFDRVDRIATTSALHALQRGGADLALLAEYQTRSIDSVLEELIADPLLRDVLVGNLPLYAAERGRTPFSTHAFITDFYNRSAFRIVGGSDAIAEALARTLSRYGGRILTNQRVCHLRCDGVCARGVETTDGSYHAADLVISTAHPRRTLEWIDSDRIRPAYRTRINGLRNTTAGFSVYLRFREGCVPYRNHNFYGYTTDTPWGCEDYTQESWPKGYLYMHTCHEANPVWARCGVVISYMSIDELAPWLDTTVGHRGPEYEAFKRRKAERLLSVVERDFPGLRQRIEAYWTSTPLTYRDYTGTEGGSMYGVVHDVQAGAGGRVSHRTRIPNLLLAGQNINSHGILGVLVGTLVTCGDLLGSQMIFKQINEACHE